MESRQFVDAMNCAPHGPDFVISQFDTSVAVNGESFGQGHPPVGLQSKDPPPSFAASVAASVVVVASTVVASVMMAAASDPPSLTLVVAVHATTPETSRRTRAAAARVGVFIQTF